ncbi:DUF3572 domain-containing protein [uncultured Roseobacter sp.]|uniref:DUF3572 domain-containing protein n=1 Tax=uncultured Roseobacter sp. TaxID=114847 RepID=UPI0026342536|nr:DUF3572 domain-containing protein [uncultured Roseobacter sp.]
MMYTRESAEVFGIRLLGWLAGNEELLPVFLGATGAVESDLRAGATDPVFLGSVMDFVMMDDTWVVQACDTLGVGYDSVMRARQVLPGGEEVNWT